MLKPLDRYLYILIKVPIRLFSLVPRVLMNRLAIPLGGFWYRVDKHHRTIALDNMTKAFKGEMDTAQIQKKVKATFIQLTTVALELTSLLKLNKDNLSRYATFSGAHHLEQALSQGKLPTKGSALPFCSHFVGDFAENAIALLPPSRFSGAGHQSLTSEGRSLTLLAPVSPIHGAGLTVLLGCGC